jgi:hypothetical protein
MGAKCERPTPAMKRTGAKERASAGGRGKPSGSRLFELLSLYLANGHSGEAGGAAQIPTQPVWIDRKGVPGIGAGGVVR